ncbi:LPXTG cell wall anchor domain-containing protein [Carnobacteriaceae bacterium zg-84]|uniref:SpaA isopeptide-forming pilin-related protein n=1 Tax=Granulicatella sp. zg-84 TaxID=2678503 RepID=UPI0013C1FB94|nr:SpaA isopeptide-forming pilin-related protein [Granulicatella sp. zg-84]NEW65600.1 LPXTG cell wall anchor domain-containing protein [Granulicatella sp. zg-84]QMI85756.1 LPXTG cell wall anchor domain-containing protein [Carnobacteriaceae bacterium zg-84]
MGLKHFLHKINQTLLITTLAASSLLSPLIILAEENPSATENHITSTYEDECKVGRNVNKTFTDVKIEHKKWDGEKVDGIPKGYSDSNDKIWEINDEQTIHTFFDGTLKNENLSLKKGDFFTVQLPPETRFEDLLQQDLARAKDIYTKDNDNALVATAHYDSTTNIITYIFTDYVETHKDIQIHTEYVETLNQDKLRGNQDYTFTGNYVGHESSYRYYLDNWSENDVTRFKSVNSQNPSEVVVKLTEVNPINKMFKTVMNAKVSGTGSKLTFTYDQDSRVSRNADTHLTIYAVPENEILDGSFRSHNNTWEDVTHTFTRTENGKNLEYTTQNNTHTKYVVVASGNYNPEFGIWVQLITTYTDTISGQTKSSGIVAYMSKEPTQEWAKAIESGDLIPVERCVPHKDLKIKKIDSIDKNKGLAGAKFIVRNEAGIEYPVTTDDKGEATVSNLKLGKYTITETEAPSGYILDKEPKTVVLDDTTPAIVPYQVENIGKRSVKITKVDADDNTKLLADVVFVLKQGNVEVKEVRTDKNGVALFEDIPYGDYTLAEKSTITGYDLNQETRQVSITEPGEPLDLGIFTNHKTIIPTFVTLEAEKMLIEKQLEAEQFKFVLKGNGIEQKIATNDKSGHITFPKLTFNKEGTYTYTITEENDGQTNITYDINEVKVLITVTKDKNSQLVAKVMYDNSDKLPTFTNKYTYPIPPSTTRVTSTTSTPNPSKIPNTKTLPHTGESTVMWIEILGITIIILTGFVYKRKNIK